MRSGHAEGGSHPLPAMTGLAREVGYLVHGARAGLDLCPLEQVEGKKRDGKKEREKRRREVTGVLRARVVSGRSDGGQSQPLSTGTERSGLRGGGCAVEQVVAGGSGSQTLKVPAVSGHRTATVTLRGATVRC